MATSERGLSVDELPRQVKKAAGALHPEALAARTQARRLRRRRVDLLAKAIITGLAFIAIAAVVLIFLFVAREALPLVLGQFKDEVTLGSMLLPQAWKEGVDAFFSWQPVSTVPKYSLAPLMVGTLKVTVIALVFAVPLAVGAAIFSAEFASRRTREIIKPAIEMLAGVPSVVLGFFALIVLASLLQSLFGLTYRLNGIVAGVALGLALVPVVYTVSEDALVAVPRAYREASLALGASRARTAWSVIVPAAAPGIFAAVVLGFGRAMGETMIVLMASGNAAVLSMDPTDSVRTIPATIAAEMGEVVVGGAHWSVLFLLGTLLFLVTLTFNTLGARYVARMRRKMGETS